MLTMRIGFAAACGAVLWSASAVGQNLQTVPPSFDTVAGTMGNSIPMANYISGTFQVMYAANQLTGIPVGSVITGMQLRLWNGSGAFPTSTFVASQYDVKLAGSSLTPGTMSTTYATNMVNPVLVRSGSLAFVANSYSGTGSPRPWGPVIPFTTGFIYPGGPLVIEWRMTSPSNTFTAYADMDSDAAMNKYMISEGNPSAATSGGISNGGPVVRLTFTPPPVDLAQGVTKVIVGNEFAGAVAPSNEGVVIWTAPYTQQAVAAANQFDTIGPGSDFVGMGWRQYDGAMTTWPAAPANFSQYDVQLSRSTNVPGALSATVASNVGADAVMVRSGALSLPVADFGIKGAEATAPFSADVGFTNRYAYKGGPLLSVVRHSGYGAGVVTYLDAMNNNSDVQAYQSGSSGATVVNNSSHYTVTRYSVDAATMSPLNLPLPGPSNLGYNFFPEVLQTVISASELRYIPVGSVIDSVWLRQSIAEPAEPPASITTLDFKVDVSSAVQQPANMSDTFASNEGPDKVRVYDGAWSLAANTMPAGSNGNFGKLVQFQRQFVYKGGPLCVTIRHATLSGTFRGPEALLGSAAINKTKYATSTGAATGANLGLGFDGTTMKLGYIPSVMTPNSIATAEGTSAWNLPFVSTYSVQTIISASQLRKATVGAAITGLSFRADFFNAESFPSVATNLPQFDITIAPAANAPLAISTTFASNIGPGATLVRSGSLTVPANAFPSAGNPKENAWYVPFSRAYVYTGGDLCVTIRGQGALASTSVYFDGESSFPIATGSGLYNYNSANAATGLTWGPLGMRLAFTARAFCPWDLNNDGVVEDSDFTIFLNAYNILDCTDGAMPQGCPADFNFDRVVDDADFVLFLPAYNTLVCP